MKYLKDKEPTDAELHAEYDTAVAAWRRPSTTRGTSWSTPRNRPKLIKKINAGAKFEDVAKAESTDSSKNNGGDLGWFTQRHGQALRRRGEGVEERRDDSEPVQSQYGWHVIKLEDTRDAPRLRSIEAAREQEREQKKLRLHRRH